MYFTHAEIAVARKICGWSGVPTCPSSYFFFSSQAYLYRQRTSTTIVGSLPRLGCCSKYTHPYLISILVVGLREARTAIGQTRAKPSIPGETARCAQGGGSGGAADAFRRGNSWRSRMWLSLATTLTTTQRHLAVAIGHNNSPNRSCASE